MRLKCGTVPLSEVHKLRQQFVGTNWQAGLPESARVGR